MTRTTSSKRRYNKKNYFIDLDYGVLHNNSNETQSQGDKLQILEWISEKSETIEFFFSSCGSEILFLETCGEIVVVLLVDVQHQRAGVQVDAVLGLGDLKTTRAVLEDSESLISSKFLIP